MQDKSASEDGKFPPSPGSKIIPAAEESAWRDGYKFLAEAERIYALEAAKGYAAGKAEGAKEAGVLVTQTAAKVDRYLASLEPKIAELALDIARRVLADFDDAELVARVARTALTEFREAKALTITVHPSAEETLAAAIAEMQSNPDWSGVAITIDTDHEAEPQSCILATEFAVVEATVDAQLAAIAEAMQIRDANS